MFYNISPLCTQKRDRPRKGTVSANKTNKRSAILANAPVRLRPTAPGEHRLTADIRMFSPQRRGGIIVHDSLAK